MTEIHGGIRPDQLTSRILNGERIQSTLHPDPTLTIRLKAPVPVGEIVVLNRAGALGRRSKHLRVVAQNGATTVVDFRNRTAEGRLAALKELSDVLATHDLLPRTRPWTRHADAVERWREAVLTLIERGQAPLSPHFLLRFVATMSSPQPTGAFEITICAEIIRQMYDHTLHLPTSALDLLKPVLKRPDHIRAVEDRLNELLHSPDPQAPTLVLSKHRVHRSELLSMKTAYLDALDQFFALCPELGVDACIFYGTLLGAVRENRFLPYDDDVDVMIFNGSRSREEAMERRDRLIETLEAMGHVVPTRFRTFKLRLNGVTLDIFPCWDADPSHFDIFMEKMEPRPLPKKVILPLSTISLYDRTFPAPADPKAFLQARYGPGWSVPDPYHEWPWPLDG